MTDAYMPEEEPAPQPRQGGFAALQRLAQLQDERQFGDPFEYPKFDLPAPSVEPIIYPSDLRYCVTVYYNPEVFADDAAVHALYDRMEREYGHRGIYLSKLTTRSLDYRRLSSFPETEARFMRRGYVTDVEGRRFDRGGIARSRYVRRNIAGLNMNAMMMATFLQKAPLNIAHARLSAPERWQQTWQTMAAVLGKETVGRDERDGRLLQPFEDNGNDMDDDIVVDSRIYPLVEHGRLLLGTRSTTAIRKIHWAYATSPKFSWDGAHDRFARDAMFGCHPTEVKKQITFEARYAYRLFQPRLIQPEIGFVDITPHMISTWYSQVIAAIRKICWLVETEEEPSLAAHRLRQEQLVHDLVLGADRIPDNRTTWDDLLRQREVELEETLLEQDAPVHLERTYSHKIPFGDEILAGLMGSTYDSHDEPNESPYSNPDIFTASLARWIGSLKRNRQEVLDTWTADAILSFWRYSRDQESLLLSQFPLETWWHLVGIAEAMEANSSLPPIPVTYRWTRDLLQPYKCNEEGDTLALEGPLLGFPSLQAELWREKSNTILALGGFEAR
ncbi:hypothetical protein SAMN05216374_3175 [Tardiphaga sp. OK246]|uniref:hypothetical protein n=1 Tax=Tardiphaga sp. OK246 TaxID=1855307 RepID=UPI000B720EA7|nr:hypothetical protein [Tardiphaga sp. OK246]SNT32411.1 hypothetical protein SAMN05216374_3175 [Tardiphaga sp. OK246]